MLNFGDNKVDTVLTCACVLPLCDFTLTKAELAEHKADEGGGPVFRLFVRDTDKKTTGGPPLSEVAATGTYPADRLNAHLAASVLIMISLHLYALNFDEYFHLGQSRLLGI